MYHKSAVPLDRCAMARVLNETILLNEFLNEAVGLVQSEVQLSRGRKSKAPGRYHAYYCAVCYIYCNVPKRNKCFH